MKKLFITMVGFVAMTTSFSQVHSGLEPPSLEGPTAICNPEIWADLNGDGTIGDELGNTAICPDVVYTFGYRKVCFSTNRDFSWTIKNAKKVNGVNVNAIWYTVNVNNTDNIKVSFKNTADVQISAKPRQNCGLCGKPTATAKPIMMGPYAGFSVVPNNGVLADYQRDVFFSCVPNGSNPVTVSLPADARVTDRRWYYVSNPGVGTLTVSSDKLSATVNIPGENYKIVCDLKFEGGCEKRYSFRLKDISGQASSHLTTPLTVLKYPCSGDNELIFDDEVAGFSRKNVEILGGAALFDNGTKIFENSNGHRGLPIIHPNGETNITIRSENVIDVCGTAQPLVETIVSRDLLPPSPVTDVKVLFSDMCNANLMEVEVAKSRSHHHYEWSVDGGAIHTTEDARWVINNVGESFTLTITAFNACNEPSTPYIKSFIYDKVSSLSAPTIKLPAKYCGGKNNTFTLTAPNPSKNVEYIWEMSNIVLFNGSTLPSYTERGLGKTTFTPDFYTFRSTTCNGKPARGTIKSFNISVIVDNCVSQKDDNKPVTVVYNCCSGSDGGSGGGAGRASAGVSIYPNPAQHRLRVEVPVSEARTKIVLLDIFGETKQTVSTTATSEVLDVSDLLNGAYIIQVVQNETHIIKHIVIQH